MSTSPKDIITILREEAKEQERNSKYFTAGVFQQAANEIERLSVLLLDLQAGKHRTVLRLPKAPDIYENSDYPQVVGESIGARNMATMVREAATKQGFIVEDM